MSRSSTLPVLCRGVDRVDEAEHNRSHHHGGERTSLKESSNDCDVPPRRRVFHRQDPFLVSVKVLQKVAKSLVQAEQTENANGLSRANEVEALSQTKFSAADAPFVLMRFQQLGFKLVMGTSCVTPWKSASESRREHILKPLFEAPHMCTGACSV